MEGVQIQTRPTGEDVGSLCITRKAGEAVIIDGKILVLVRRIEGGQVRLIIKAPKSVSIKREELTK